MALQGSILVVDDNRNIRVSLKYLLEGCFTKVLLVDTPELLPSMLRQEQIDVVLLDMNFSPGLNTGNEGLYWLREIKRLRPQAQVVLFTAYADIALAVTGIKEGAFDFVVKPWDNAKLKQTLTDAYRLAKGKRHNGKRMEQEPVDAMYWGNTPAMERIKVMTERISASDANVLITGENGTGKDMLAREIHRMSQRGNKQFVAVDMGAIAESLFESELCVGDIALVLGMSQSAVSHQLRVLKDSKLIKFRREGKVIFYSLDDDHVRTIMSMGMEHVEE